MSGGPWSRVGADRWRSEAGEAICADSATPGQQPFLRIVRGDATPEEIAALVAVIASMGGTAPAPSKPRSTWAHPARGLRSAHRHGPGAWRASGLPR